MGRKRCCCNCAHCIRIPDEKYGIALCRCEVHGFYLSYVGVFEYWCKKWKKEKKKEKKKERKKKHE